MALCKHCHHPEHAGICGVMTETITIHGSTKWGCQCRVEIPIPDSWKQGWIRTASGIKFFWSEPTPEMIVLKDIAHHLAQKSRFSGACRYFHSVAMHSLIVAAIVDAEYRDPWLNIHALLHDCSEFILPDIPSPMKPRIPWWHEAEDKIELAVAQKFGLDPKLFHDKRIKEIDWAVLNEEGSVLVPNWENENYDGHLKSARPSIVLSANRNWEHVRSQFINAFTNSQKGLHL